MYATDRRQTDRCQTSDANHRLKPPPYGGIIIVSKQHSVIIQLNTYKAWCKFVKYESEQFQKTFQDNDIKFPELSRAYIDFQNFPGPLKRWKDSRTFKNFPGSVGTKSTVFWNEGAIPTCYVCGRHILRTTRRWPCTQHGGLEARCSVTLGLRVASVHQFSNNCSNCENFKPVCKNDTAYTTAAPALACARPKATDKKANRFIQKCQKRV